MVMAMPSMPLILMANQLSVSTRPCNITKVRFVLHPHYRTASWEQIKLCVIKSFGDKIDALEHLTQSFDGHYEAYITLKENEHVEIN